MSRLYAVAVWLQHVVFNFNVLKTGKGHPLTASKKVVWAE